MSVVKDRLSDQVARELQAMNCNQLYQNGDKLPLKTTTPNVQCMPHHHSRVVRILSNMGILDVRPATALLL